MYLLYDGLFERIRRLYFRKTLDAYATTSSRLLDYGCGPGDMLQECKRRGLTAYGMDNSPYSVELARERGLDVILGSYDEIPAELRDLDIVFSHSVLEHVQRPLELIDALKHRLSEGGLLILSAPTPEPAFWDDPTHVRPYTPKAFRALAELCGLELIEVNYVFAFLLGLRLSSPVYYRVLNLLPFAAGSNLVAVFRRSVAGDP